jgi:hypothetical protein
LSSAGRIGGVVPAGLISVTVRCLDMPQQYKRNVNKDKHKNVDYVTNWIRKRPK